MAHSTINRLLIFPLIIILAISFTPFDAIEAVESNHVKTKLEQDAVTTTYFNPNPLLDFELIFYSETRDFDITMNFSAVDSGGVFDPANWEITFDPDEFTVGFSEDVVVTVTISTNLTTSDKGRSLEITVWGDVADDDRDDIDTNAQTFKAIIAERDDVKLSVDQANERKLVYPQKETRFTVSIKNVGWSANSITLSARIVDNSAANWTVRVIYSSFDGMESQEIREGIINITSPETIEPGDYTLEIIAHVGDFGRDTLNVEARVALPDLRIKEVVSLYNPALHDSEVQFTAVIENLGGYVEDITVRGEVKGHENKWERLPDSHIESITNYNESSTILTWKAEMTDKNSFSETWTVRITVDYLFSIDETEEGNNQGETTIEVRSIEKATVSFNLAPAFMILGIMMVFTAVVAFDRKSSRNRK